ncbi:MAG: glycosyltransferase family 4 protein [Planctomycetes bacterium]|nr:glycosyltransferase family 4 protein [Planctomycetota bacterium]
MRILFFVHRFRPSVGGVEKYILELARALSEGGHTVSVVAGDHIGSLPARESYEGITIRRFPATRSPQRCRWHLLRMRPLFRSADVISVSNTHMLEYYWRMFGPQVEPHKLFLIRHGMSCVYPVPDGEKRRAKRSVGLVRGVAHDGEFIEKWLGIRPDLCPDQGLSPAADRLDPVAEPPPTSATYIGRLEPDTGIHTYIDAIRILTKRQGRCFKLHVYGDGSLMGSLRDLVHRDDLPVVFHGRTANAQEKIVESCFAFLDGRMAIQEAMARRRLVLAAYVDPLKRDYVCVESFSPFLHAMGDAEAFAAKTMHFIDNPEARADGVAQAYRFVCGLRWSDAAKTYAKFWQERLGLPFAKASRWKCAWVATRIAQEAKRRASGGGSAASGAPFCLSLPHPAG